MLKSTSSQHAINPLYHMNLVYLQFIVPNSKLVDTEVKTATGLFDHRFDQEEVREEVKTATRAVSPSPW